MVRKDEVLAQRDKEDSVGGFCGIGIRHDLEPVREGIRITELVRSPFETPARRAGLEVGDIITHYRFSPREEWKSILPSADVIRGAQGTPISLRMIRGRTGESYETTLIRDAIIETPAHYVPGMELRFIPFADSKCQSLVQAPEVPVLPSSGMRRTHMAGR